MKGKLFLKIFGTYLVIAVLAIGIVGFLAGNQIQAKLEQQIEDELMAYAGIVDLYPMQEIQSRAEEIARIMVELVAAEFASGKQLDPEVALVAGPPLPWWRKWWRKLTGDQ